MKKENSVTLILSTIGGILFAIGMCLCLLPEWNAFTQGVVMSAVGIVVLFVMLVVRRKMKGMPAIKVTGKAVGTVALGIVLLLCLIPLCKGLK